MSGAALLPLAACLLAAVILAAWTWFDLARSACQLFRDRLARASRDSSCTSGRPGEGDLPQGADRGPDREPQSGSPPHSTRLTPPVVDFGRRDYHAVALVAVALQPDFEAFFSGLEVAAIAGGGLVIALVVVLSIRRLTSF